MSRVILFYNSMWGGPLDYPLAEIPRPYVLTTERDALDEAVAVVFHMPTLPADVRSGAVEKRPGQLWVAWSMECETHYPQMNDRAVMAFFDLTMTYRLDADVFAPYLGAGLGAQLRAPPSRKTPGNLANAFISSPYDASGRTELLSALMSCMKVHSYGKLFRNIGLANDEGRQTKHETIRTYKFTLAFENAVARDYVTEKFYDPLIVGSVPVYLGAPNIEDFAPGDDCFIDAGRWRPADLARYLVELSEDETEYERFLAWKRRPFRNSFDSMLAKVRTHPFARLCGKVEERLKLAAAAG